MIQLLCKTVWQFLITINIYYPYDQEISFLNIYPQKIKTCPQKNLHGNFLSNFIHNSPKFRTARMSISSGVEFAKANNSYSGLLLGKKKCSIDTINRDESQNIVLSKRSQTQEHHSIYQKIQEHSKLTYSDRNQNNGCLW